MSDAVLASWNEGKAEGSDRRFRELGDDTWNGVCRSGRSHRYVRQ